MKNRTLIGCLAVLAAASAAWAQSANFDSETEGFKGQTFTSGGITFSDVNYLVGIYPDGSVMTPEDVGQEVIIEDSTFAAMDFPEFISSPNTITFGRAYIPGENLSIGALSTVTMSYPQLCSEARFDVIYYENGPWGGIVVTLEAINEGQVVGSTSFTIPSPDPGGRDNPTARVMTISGVQFTSLRLSATLNGVPTTFRALLDNVEFTPAGTTCPTDWDLSGTVNSADISAFLSSWLESLNNQTLLADFDGNGSVNSADISAFLAAWLEDLGGC